MPKPKLYEGERTRAVGLSMPQSLRDWLQEMGQLEHRSMSQYAVLILMREKARQEGDGDRPVGR